MSGMDMAAGPKRGAGKKFHVVTVVTGNEGRVYKKAGGRPVR